MEIRDVNAADLLKDALNMLYIEGKERSPRGLKVKELIDLRLVLSRPWENLALFDARPRSLRYLCNELKWYFHGDQHADEISKAASLWKDLAENGLVNSNYGYLAFKERIMTPNKVAMRQFDWCVEALKNDIESRQAVINYNAPRHKYKGVKDFPCTMYSQFIVRDEKLECYTYMRSQDAIWGFTYDITYFTILQMLLLEMLKDEHDGIFLGAHYLNVGSFHIYEKHWGAIDTILGSEISKWSMPTVRKDLYRDIIDGTSRSNTMRWIDDILRSRQEELRTR